jgi:hypothetical protein
VSAVSDARAFSLKDRTVFGARPAPDQDDLDIEDKAFGQ